MKKSNMNAIAVGNWRKQKTGSSLIIGGLCMSAIGWLISACNDIWFVAANDECKSAIQDFYESAHKNAK